MPWVSLCRMMRAFREIFGPRDGMWIALGARGVYFSFFFFFLILYSDAVERGCAMCNVR